MTTTKLTSFLKYSAMFVVACFTVSLNSCGSKDPAPEPPPTLNISELIASDAFKQSATVTEDVALDSLNKYINLYPDLQALMTGTTEYTLFAPSNLAFKNLLSTPGFPGNITLINPDLIKGVFAYHFITGNKLKASLTSGSVLYTLYTDAASGTDQTIVVNSDGTLKTGSTNAAIHITKEDNKATNGAVQIVESVMIPPTVGATITPLLGTMAGTIFLAKDFTDMVKLIGVADAGFVEDPATGKFKISTWLAMPISSSSKTTANISGTTFFAMPNLVFQFYAASQGITEDFLVNTYLTQSISQADLRALLLNGLISTGMYTVDGSAGTTKFANNQVISPLSGTPLAIAITAPSGPTADLPAGNPYGVVVAQINSSAQVKVKGVIVSKDLLHNNGVIQVFAGILDE